MMYELMYFFHILVISAGGVEPIYGNRRCCLGAYKYDELYMATMI